MTRIRARARRKEPTVSRAAYEKMAADYDAVVADYKKLAAKHKAAVADYDAAGCQVQRPGRRTRGDVRQGTPRRRTS